MQCVLEHQLIVKLTIEQVDILDSRKFKELSFQAQVKNSHHINHQLVQRLNGAPCLENYITGRSGVSQEDQFEAIHSEYFVIFRFDPSFRQAFAMELETFASKHSTRDQLFGETAREKCLYVTGKMCEMCIENPQKAGEKLVMVPQPQVDEENSSYQHVAKSSYINRDVDDFLPRKHLDQQFQSKLLEQEEDVLAFS